MTGYKRGYMYADPETEGKVGMGAALLMFVLGTAVLSGVLILFIWGVFVPWESSDTTPTHPEKEIVQTNYFRQGDDNKDGHIDETESGWNCETMGNKICGPHEHRMKLS